MEEAKARRASMLKPGVRDGSWEVMQKKAFLGWVNVSAPGVQEDYKDLSDGTVLLGLVERFEDEPKLRRWNRRKEGRDLMDAHKLDNNNILLDFLKKKSDRVFVAAPDVTSAQPKAILSLLWAFISIYEPGVSKFGESALLEWVHEVTGKSVHSYNDFQDGSLFAHLLRAIDTSLLSSDVFDLEPLERLEKVFSVAFDKLSIARLLDPIDFKGIVDHQALRLYLCLFHAKFEASLLEQKKNRDAANQAYEMQQLALNAKEDSALAQFNEVPENDPLLIEAAQALPDVPPPVLAVTSGQAAAIIKGCDAEPIAIPPANLLVATRTISYQGSKCHVVLPQVKNPLDFETYTKSHKVKFVSQDGKELPWSPLTFTVDPHEDLVPPEEFSVKDVHTNEDVTATMVAKCLSNAQQPEVRFAVGEKLADKLSDGTYQIVVEADGYCSDEKIVVIKNGTVSKRKRQPWVVPKDNRVKPHLTTISLTWGEHPRDLDLHLISSTGQHVYYSKMNHEHEGEKGHFWLDVDCTNGNGQETIELYAEEDVTYFVVVYHFAGESDIQHSGGQVKILIADDKRKTRPIATPTAPTVGQGVHWMVCSLRLQDGVMTSSQPPRDAPGWTGNGVVSLVPEALPWLNKSWPLSPGFDWEAMLADGIQKNHLIFCLDESGSMGGSPWAGLNDAYSSVIRARQVEAVNDIVSVVQFGSNARLTVDCELVAAAPLSLQFGDGGTNFPPGLLMSIAQAKKLPLVPAVIIFMTDGCGSPFDCSEIRASCPSAKFHAVAFGSANEGVLRNMAAQAGGEFHNALGSDVSKLVNTFKAISSNIGSR